MAQLFEDERRFERSCEVFTRFGDRPASEHQRLTGESPRDANAPEGFETAMRDVGNLILRNEPLPRAGRRLSVSSKYIARARFAGGLRNTMLPRALPPP
jgi:hypothetical protein